MAIVARCRNASEGEEWGAFVRGDARFEEIVREEAGRMAAVKPATVREWCRGGQGWGQVRER